MVRETRHFFCNNTTGSPRNPSLSLQQHNGWSEKPVTFSATTQLVRETHHFLCNNTMAGQRKLVTFSGTTMAGQINLSLSLQQHNGWSEKLITFSATTQQLVRETHHFLCNNTMAGQRKLVTFSGTTMAGQINLSLSLQQHNGWSEKLITFSATISTSKGPENMFMLLPLFRDSSNATWTKMQTF